MNQFDDEEPRKGSIILRVSCSDTIPGEIVALLGGGPSLGRWGAEGAVPLRLRCSHWPHWVLEMPLQVTVGEQLEYKYFIMPEEETNRDYPLWETGTFREKRKLSVDAALLEAGVHDDGEFGSISGREQRPRATVSGPRELRKHLQQLSEQPNKFQHHAQASLRLLERRRRNLLFSRIRAHKLPTASVLENGSGQSSSSIDLTKDPAGQDVAASSQSTAGQAEGDVTDRCSSPEEPTKHVTVPEDLADSSPARPGGMSRKPAFDARSEGGGPCAMSQVHSAPQMSRSQELADPASSSMTAVSSMPLFDNSDDFPSDVYDLLSPTTESKRVAFRDAATSGLRLHCGAHQIPHPRKQETGGEDSYFICDEGQAAGVADGVGDWEWRFGLNPRAFADELMAGAKKSVIGDLNNPRVAAAERASKGLRDGFGTATSFGSATALVATLNAHGTELGVANLGDSGLRHIRRRHDGEPDVTRVIKRTDEQQHAFNTPYQLARLPTPADFPMLIAQGKRALVRAVQHTPPSRLDLPEHANSYTMPVREGDLLVLGTDGLFDNLHDFEVCRLADLAISPLEAGQIFEVDSGRLRGGGSTDPENIAKAIATAALLRSSDRCAKTPFSGNAKEAGLCHYGGKMDDITVVVAWVVRTSTE